MALLPAMCNLLEIEPDSSMPFNGGDTSVLFLCDPFRIMNLILYFDATSLNGVRKGNWNWIVSNKRGVVNSLLGGLSLSYLS